MSKFRNTSRRGLVVAMALGLMVAVSVAGIAIGAVNKEEACVSNVCIKAGGGFSPKKLSKTKQTPIGLTVEGKIKTTDGSHPPALREAIVETDKNGAIDVKGYPKCKASQLQSQDTPHAKEACKPALIGEGKATAAVSFPESADVNVNTKLLVFNGGEKGGVTTLFIHAYFSNPVPGAIVTTVKIKKVHHGRYGTESIATIPKIASGAGSITSFQLKIDKKFTRGGKKVSILTAKCPDGRLQAHATAKFEGGLKAETEFVRPCTGV
jgi:hypothetical protein